MKANFFNKKFNIHNISHAYLFECKESNESYKQIDTFIKTILCTSNKEKSFFCNNCKSCKSFNGNSNPDYLEIFPDDKDKIGIGSLRGDSDKNRGIINVLNETALISNAKVIKINCAEKLNEEAQNYLLKILEEPPKNSHIIMHSSRPFKLKKTILSRLIRISIQRTGLKNEINGIKIDPLFSEILHREYDVDEMSEKELNFLLDLFKNTIESLGNFSFSKERILDSWNDDYLNFRLNVLKQNIFQTILGEFKKTNNKNLVITSSLDEERLFLFLEEIISLQALLANKVPINKKVQLDAIFDFIK
jgi:DNA polymerase III delta prime subunit